MTEFSCPWITNREKKDKEEKTNKYTYVRLGFQQRHEGHTVKTLNAIIDPLERHSHSVDIALRNAWRKRSETSAELVRRKSNIT